MKKDASINLSRIASYFFNMENSLKKRLFIAQPKNSMPYRERFSSILSNHGDNSININLYDMKYQNGFAIMFQMRFKRITTESVILNIRGRIISINRENPKAVLFNLIKDLFNSYRKNFNYVFSLEEFSDKEFNKVENELFIWILEKLG